MQSHKLDSHDGDALSQPNNVIPTKQKRRSRLAKSCLECRRRKSRCDSLKPCSQCSRLKKECVFASSRTSPLIAQDEDVLQITPMTTLDASYNENSFSDDLVDYGIVLGKTRLTERLGGLFRPSLAQEVRATLARMDRKALDEGRHMHPTLEDGLALTAKDFEFGYESSPHNSGLLLGFGADVDLTSYLPNRLAADKLLSEYFTNVNVIACAVHRPSLEKAYEMFWHEQRIGGEISKPTQALCFAAMFSGAVSMDEKIIARDFGVSKRAFVEKLQVGTELALRAAEFMRTTKFITVQAFVMYLIPQCLSEVSRSHSVLVGAALRLAECLGLHRDGTTTGLDPLETHVRRLVWHQLCFLDMRTCEAQGPKPGVRKEDYDTLFPLNVNDQDLHSTGVAPNNQPRWTDATFSLMRFECTEMLRFLWFERRKMYSSTKTLTAVLRKIKDFQDYMSGKYDRLLDDRVPIQKCARLLKDLMMSHYHVLILFPFYGSVSQLMPDRLRQVLIEAGTRDQEMSLALDTTPEIATWKWYSGAYNQYTVAFLLLTEIFIFPERKQADRIWRCLDYVYDLDSDMPRDFKARSTLMALQRKLAAYQIIRGLRSPPSMTQWNHLGMDSYLNTEITTEAKGKGSTEKDFNATPMSGPDKLDSSVSNSEAVNIIAVEASATLFQQNNSSFAGAAQDSFSSTFTAVGSVPTSDPVPDDIFIDIDWSEWDTLFPPDCA